MHSIKSLLRNKARIYFFWRAIKGVHGEKKERLWACQDHGMLLPMTNVDLTFLSSPSDEELRSIVGLYRQAGWWPAGEAEDYLLLAKLVRQSHCFVAARAGDRIIGMGRAISDGVSDAYVQDVVVDPAWRGAGVGSRIVGRILERLAADGLGWIGLIAERDSAPFYTRLGFEEMGSARPMRLLR
jgi:spermidine synthase